VGPDGRIATAPDDVTVSESISTAALGAVLISPAVALGAAVGASIADRKSASNRNPD
jgi:hypothetical protein